MTGLANSGRVRRTALAAGAVLLSSGLMFVAAPVAGAAPAGTSTPATFATAGQQHIECHVHVNPPHSHNHSIEAGASTHCKSHVDEINIHVALEKREHSHWHEVAWDSGHRHHANFVTATARKHCVDGDYRTSATGDATDGGDHFHDHKHSHEVHIHCHHSGLSAS